MAAIHDSSTNQVANTLQKMPGRLQNREFRAVALTLWLLPLLQSLASSMATPKTASFTGAISGNLFWICATLPLWWLSHFASKWLLARTGTRGKTLWIGLGLASMMAFLAADLSGYFFLLDQIFSRWLGVFEAPFQISKPSLSIAYSKAAISGALGHALIWLGANLSVRFLLGKTIYEPDSVGTTATQIPPFLNRVPEDLRHDLLAIQAQEHYMAVHTTGGSKLILYRFGDALGELKETPGIQVHRSFWVADGAVANHERKSGQLFLTLRNGQEVPVSRTFVRQVEKSGLLESTLTSPSETVASP